jgi:hypothetical protein
VELHQRRHSRRGARLQFERLAKKNTRCPPRKAWRPGWLSYVRCSREGQEKKSCCFAAAQKPCLSNVSEEIYSCARGQVDRPQQPPAEGHGDQSAGNPEARDAIHSGAPLITPPLVGKRAGGLKRLGCWFCALIQ